MNCHHENLTSDDLNRSRGQAIYHTSRSGLVDLKQLRWGVVESALGPNAGLRPGRHTLWLLVLLRAGGVPHLALLGDNEILLGRILVEMEATPRSQR